MGRVIVGELQKSVIRAMMRDTRGAAEGDQTASPTLYSHQKWRSSAKVKPLADSPKLTPLSIRFIKRIFL